jgi:hypothetical protein
MLERRLVVEGGRASRQPSRISCATVQRSLLDGYEQGNIGQVQLVLLSHLRNCKECTAFAERLKSPRDRLDHLRC